MYMSKKGRGYDSATIIVTALQQTKLSPGIFFLCALRFEKSNPFDPSSEAQKFAAWQASEQGNVDYKPPPVARAFADWVLVADPKKVAQRIQSLSTAQ
jgi:hypothetical protein